MANKKISYTYEDSMNPDVKEKQVFVNGKRIRIRPEVEVECDPIVKEIIDDSKKLQKKVSKSDEKFVVMEN